MMKLKNKPVFDRPTKVRNEWPVTRELLEDGGGCVYFRHVFWAGRFCRIVRRSNGFFWLRAV